AAFQVFDIVYIMTNAQENQYTGVLNLYIYRQFSEYAAYGYAAAIGVVIFMLTLLATVFQLVATRATGGAT
ncbi:MAG: sugar ABC transporter permease, partial [Rhodospirillales bacterium]|nr:sugar ABC transporter permease [Rhodospirillales bacterium]